MFRKEQKVQQRDGFRLAGLARSLQIPEDFAKGNILVTMQGQERICLLYTSDAADE